MHAQSTDTLLVRARHVFDKDPEKGISMANKAYLNSLRYGEPAETIKSLNLITLFYWTKYDHVSAAMASQKALIAAQKAGIDSLTGDSWVLNGLIYYSKNNYDLAISNYQQAVGCYQKARSAGKLGKCFRNIGLAEKKLARFEQANFYYFKAADIFIKLNDKNALSDTYNSIGLNFLALNNNGQSVAYLEKGSQLRVEARNKPLIAESYNNIGYVFKKAGQPDSAIFYLSKCLAIRKLDNDSSLMVLPLQNLGASWLQKGELNKVGPLLQRSLNIASKYDMAEETADGYLDMAGLYLAQKRYANALASANITEQTAKKLKLSDLLKDEYTLRSAIYQQEGDYKNALLYEKKRDIINDSLFTVAKNRDISELEIRYQTTQKEKDIALLNAKGKLQQSIVNQQRTSIIALFIVAGLLLLLFAIAYNSFRVKNKANLRIQTLMRELHHRVKNNLQILSGLFTMQIDNMNDEKTKNTLRENEARLTSMNLIHNKLYLNNDSTQIEMEEYLTNLLEHIKDSFSGGRESDINLRVDVEQIMLEADKAVAIGLLINELATNAFKYAFDDNAGEIYLGLKQESRSKLLLTLKDNGKGLQKQEKERQPSFGLKLVNLMARQLNSTLVVQSGEGVSYQMEISI